MRDAEIYNLVRASTNDLRAAIQSVAASLIEERHRRVILTRCLEKDGVITGEKLRAVLDELSSKDPDAVDEADSKTTMSVGEAERAKLAEEQKEPPAGGEPTGGGEETSDSWEGGIKIVPTSS